MFDHWLKLPAHHYLYITGLSLMALGLPLNKVVLSIGSIWVVANWILEGNFREKWTIIKSTKLLYPIYVLLLLHLIGLFYSTDLTHALNDLKIKLPFFSIPVIVASSPALSQTKRNFIFTIFLFSLALTTLINHGLYHGWLNENTAYDGDIRGMSNFISHIRLSWMLVLGILISAVFYWKKWINRWIWLPLIVWFTIYIYDSQSITGILFLAIALFSSFIYIVFNQPNKWIKIAFFSVLVIIISVFGIQIRNTIIADHTIQTVNIDSLSTHTANGNIYFNDVDINIYENGNIVFIYYAEEEMIHEWNKKSNLNGFGLDKKGNELKYTLARYLTSLGFRKDSIGVNKLSDKDIGLIENGVSNYKYAKKGVYLRIAHFIEAIIYPKPEYNPNGSSLLQRKEHYKAAIHILKNNYLVGVGNGDLDTAFQQAYSELDSKLILEYRNRAHNQYLTFWISFGIIGFLATLLIVFLPLYPTFKSQAFLPILFLIMLVFIFATEDALETQAGASFVALFYGLFLIRLPFNGSSSSLR